MSTSRLCVAGFRRILTGPANTSFGQQARFHSTILPQCQRASVSILLQNQHQSCQLQFVRHTNFFNRVKANNLWESVISVSNAGRKKGRGKRVGRKKATDLNRGQYLGDGQANMVWPGLNAPVIKNRMVVRQTQLPETDRIQKLIDLREAMSRIKYPSTPPLLRGFTGGRMVGMKFGPPDPIGDYSFEGFDSALVELKGVTNMTGTLGRKMHYTAFVIVGNGNGLAGYGLGRGSRVGNAVRIAKNRASQRLYYIERFDGHTVYHNMFSQFHKSKIFIQKKERGFGLRCHRVLKSICEMIGIGDIYCKVERNTGNVKAVTKGFFNALATQETHQTLADRMGYHVVEMREETENRPVVVASPSDGIVNTVPCEREANVDFDLDRLYMDGKIEYKRKQGNPFANRKSFKKGEARRHVFRNQRDIHIQRAAGLF